MSPREPLLVKRYYLSLELCCIFLAFHLTPSIASSSLSRVSGISGEAQYFQEVAMSHRFWVNLTKFAILLFFLVPSSIVTAQAAFQDAWYRVKAACEASGGRAASNYADWEAQNGCICPGSNSGSGSVTCSKSPPQPQWVVGQAHPVYPNVVATETPGSWRCRAGYTWMSDYKNGDLRTRWDLGGHHPDFPNVIASANEREWHAAPGYAFVDTSNNNDLSVRWVVGARDPDRPYIVASERVGRWSPADGYRFTNSRSGDLRVTWRPGVPSRSQPRVLSADEEGKWHPQDGFLWVSPGPDYYRQTFDFVGSAVAFANRVATLNEYKTRLDETVAGRNKDRVEDALKIFATGWLVRLPLASEMQREVVEDRAKEKIKDLMKNTLADAINLIQRDMATLTPFERGNPFNARRRQVVRQTAIELQAASDAAQRQLNGSNAFKLVRSGPHSAILVEPVSFKELNRIVRAGKWKD